MSAAPTTRTLGRDDWMTPPEVFDPLDHAFGGFDLDAAAFCPEESRCERYIGPEEDALVTPWASRVTAASRFFQRPDGTFISRIPAVWCNPPYKLAARFLARASEQALTGHLLAAVMVFANTDTNYWKENVVNAPNIVGVLLLHKRVKFILPGDGEDARAGAPKGSAIVLYGPEERERLSIPHAYWTHRDATGRGTPGAPVVPLLGDLFNAYR